MSSWTRGGGGQSKADTCGQRGEGSQNVQKMYIYIFFKDAHDDILFLI